MVNGFKPSQAFASSSLHSPLLDSAAVVSHTTVGLSAEEEATIHNGCLEKTKPVVLAWWLGVFLRVVFVGHYLSQSLVNGRRLRNVRRSRRRD